MSQPVVVLVSGFLGAGKTTFLLAAAARLRASGVRVGVITNDQAGDLVDTRLAAASGFETREVAGGCFCCHYGELVAAIDAFSGVDVILAEPVGSCIDITATVVQPLKALGRVRVAPLTVLVDPTREVAPDIEYLFRNQIAEADILCAAKCDVAAPAGDLPYDHHVSAVTGQGIAEWLADVLGGTRAVGAHVLDVEYRRYVEAEGALGWLNWHAHLRLDTPLSPAQVVGPFVDGLDSELTSARIGIAHLKVFAESRTGYVKASVCRNGEEPSVHGILLAEAAREHDVVLNLRAMASPEALRDAVGRVVARLPGRARVLQYQAFRPVPK